MFVGRSAGPSVCPLVRFCTAVYLALFTRPCRDDNGLTFLHGPRFLYWFIHMFRGITAFGIINIMFSWAHWRFKLRKYEN